MPLSIHCPRASCKQSRRPDEYIYKSTKDSFYILSFSETLNVNRFKNKIFHGEMTAITSFTSELSSYFIIT